MLHNILILYYGLFVLTFIFLIYTIKILFKKITKIISSCILNPESHSFESLWNKIYQMEKKYTNLSLNYHSLQKHVVNIENIVLNQNNQLKQNNELLLEKINVLITEIKINNNNFINKENRTSINIDDFPNFPTYD